MLKRFSYILFIVMTALAMPLGHAANSTSLTDSLFNRDKAEDEFLSPDLAFGLDIVRANNEINANFKVADGYYLYKQRIKFTLTPDLAHTVKLPQAEIKDDPNFGKMEVYHHDFTGVISIQGANTTPITIKATYQGCSEKGLCYAPQNKTFIIDPASAGSSTDNSQTSTTPNKTASANADSNISDDDGQAANLLKSGKWWLIILGFFTAGLLLSFTPCVFPMIPILSSIIIGKNAHVTRLHAFNLSLAYTMGMCLTYTLAGIAAGLSGQMLSSALQTPWALGFGALVFAVLALSMFGFYELKLPSSLENGLMSMSRRIKGGKFFSDFLMGVLSALIISPCVAAPLAGALLYISKSHDVVLGGVALFSLSLGMGTPLLLIGASAGTLLPKVGSWMNAVRNLFGVLMLAVALWLITPIIPVSLQLALWAALLIVPAIFMHALDPLPIDAKPALRFWKGIALMLLITGLALLVGALSGAKSPLQPLGGLTASVNSSESRSNLDFKKVKNIAELDAALQNAQGKLVMLDFYADWCVSCKELEQFTFSDARVQAALKDSVLLKADVTANSDDDKALLQRFNLFGPPGIIFFNTQSKEEKNLKVIGYKNADDFLKILDQRGSCLPETTQC
ncbi:MAG: thiol:disulfide interchange protein [Methylotenera sp. 24-45-7]|jgi:thiol:disulfide interchange protein DsbD|nr:MAG: thiol:disulfide interchange protein [Mehylophilales bacterium 35-46-6]OYY84139.1 MAG: thiol:disulfide interchange protein [Methylophilales bacterium 16-45-9]OYZ41536.1 MAG: thiol:disulfide interchange protein [Methylotenera sp. 24-45-7]OZA08580.1 MAG: thiol:disulfide interchange protein [Methylotenera sp. 17-45-7]HQS43878.1 protein-disulfide reductase DsbD [Methylotenera sp.]